MEKINVEISMLRHNLAKRIRLEEFWVAEVMVIIKYIWKYILKKKEGWKNKYNYTKLIPLA